MNAKAPYQHELCKVCKVSCGCRQTRQGLPTLGPRPHPVSSFPSPEAGPSCALHLGPAERCDTEEQSSSHAGPHVPSQDPPVAPTQRAQAEHQHAHHLPAWHNRAQPMDFKDKAGDKAALDVSQLRQHRLRGPGHPTRCSCGFTSAHVSSAVKTNWLLPPDPGGGSPISAASSALHHTGFKAQSHPRERNFSSRRGCGLAKGARAQPQAAAEGERLRSRAGQAPGHRHISKVLLGREGASLT